MGDTRYDVVAVGNAIVDILAHAEEALITRFPVARGGMTLIDEETSRAIYDAMGPAVEASGGSAANTAAGVASLGGKAAYIGKVRDDQLGRIFRHDINAIGVLFDTPALTTGPATATSMIMITPDGERTMCTYLGACVTLSKADIDEEVVKSSAVTYVEGYLWDEPAAKDAILHAMSVAKDAGRKVSLSLSDTFCVDRHRAEFQKLVAGQVDILFANEDEICSLYEIASFDEAAERVRQEVEVAALTRGPKGSVVATADGFVPVSGSSIKRVDSTGAGDLYAAGFLFGYTRGMALDDCARIGGVAAEECISHVGPRPQHTLADLVKERLDVAI